MEPSRLKSEVVVFSRRVGVRDWSGDNVLGVGGLSYNGMFALCFQVCQSRTKLVLNKT